MRWFGEYTYSKRKARKLLRYAYRRFRKKGSLLPKNVQEQIKRSFASLKIALDEKSRPAINECSHNLHILVETYLKKPFAVRWLQSLGGILLALALAFLIRQMWFELYEIPSGSMRPTLQEKDRLVVSKTTFGINVPFTTHHFLFEPHLAKRGGIVIFTGKDLDIADVDTRYFYLFPGKKQFVKRLIGKPGDTLYFYGGKIYGIDAAGGDITPLISPLLKDIDHVPYIRMEGKVVVNSPPINNIYPKVLLYQMNQPVAEMLLSHGRVKGQMLTQKHKLLSLPPVPEYFDLWGFKNYAMVRLITPSIAYQMHKVPSHADTALFLEITHHPSLKGAYMHYDALGRMRPTLHTEHTLLPLNTAQLETLFGNLYTSRFVVNEGSARRFGQQQSGPYSAYYPKLEGVPDGMYEIQDGKAYKVGFGGILEALPSDHPLMTFSRGRLLTLFNLGIEWDIRFNPNSDYLPVYPARYAYFKDKSLYVMGKPLLQKEDPTLLEFIHSEYLRQESAKTLPYYPFEDTGPPLLENGEVDAKFIERFGITVPEGHYLVLGDNYAVSGDSREFGFVPEGNLRGAPSFIFWPPGPRFGPPRQPPYPWATLPNFIIGALILVTALACYFYYGRCQSRLSLEEKDIDVK